jgi:type I restriction enzyme S subunit
MTQSKEIQWLPLGKFIKARNERNNDLRYGVELIEGVTSTGDFAPTKAKTEGINMKPYKVVMPGDFAYNPSRLNIGSLAYREGEMCIVSHLYVVFYIKDKHKCNLLPQYLMLFFRRTEFLRMVDYYNYGSQRAEFNIHDISQFKIPVPFKDGKPDIERQQEIVNIWDGLRKLRDDNLAIAEPLLQLCKAKVEELKHSTPMVELGNYIKVKEKLNSDNLDLPVKGLNKDKVFMPTAANMDGIKLSKYLVVENGMFAFSGMQTGRDVCIRIALNESSEQFLISPAYTTFIIDSDEFIPSFIYIWFMRAECDRLGWFLSDSSVRSNLDWNRFLSIKVPKPTVEVQQAIVDIYKCAKRAKDIAADADNQLKTICPALLQYVIHN